MAARLNRRGVNAPNLVRCPQRAKFAASRRGTTTFTFAARFQSGEKVVRTRTEEDEARMVGGRCRGSRPAARPLGATGPISLAARTPALIRANDQTQGVRNRPLRTPRVFFCSWEDSTVRKRTLATDRRRAPSPGEMECAVKAGLPRAIRDTWPCPDPAGIAHKMNCRATATECHRHTKARHFLCQAQGWMRILRLLRSSMSLYP